MLSTLPHFAFMEGYIVNFFSFSLSFVGIFLKSDDCGGRSSYVRVNTLHSDISGELVASIIALSCQLSSAFTVCHIHELCKSTARTMLRMNLTLLTCCVSSGTVSARYCWLPRAVSGANPGMKKCRRGKGTILTASLRRSALSCPGNLRHVVTPDIVTCWK